MEPPLAPGGRRLPWPSGAWINTFVLIPAVTECALSGEAKTQREAQIA